ncbi:MAG: hypothetical protein WC457_02595 [Patescibacteria group bacterium]
MAKKFFEQPLSDAELTNAVDAKLDAFEAAAAAKETEKWRHEAMNAVAIQRLITETIDKIRDFEGKESFTREKGEENPGDHDKIVAELKNLHDQWDSARAIEQNILFKLESAGKTIEDANYESASIPEASIESAKAELLDMISEVSKEHAAQEAARQKIANIDEPFHDVKKAA